MPACNLPPPSSVAGDTPSGAQGKFEIKRRCLIDNIAFLIVRQHRRGQLDADESESKSAARTCHK